MSDPSEPLARNMSGSPILSETGWYPAADKLPTHNLWSLRANHTVRAVVLHVVQGTYESAIDWLSQPKSMVSAHFVVAKDGRVAQLVSIDDTAWGNGLHYDSSKGIWVTPPDPKGKVWPANPSWRGLIRGVNPNFYTISVEHEGCSQEPWTAAMYDANLGLLRWIRDVLGMTFVLHETLIGHSELDHATRSYCPGPNVDWDRMVRDLSAP